MVGDRQTVTGRLADAHVARDHRLEDQFREVLAQYRYGAQPSGPRGLDCAKVVTPVAKQRATAQVVLPDRKKTFCFILGPELLTGRSVTKAVVNSIVLILILDYFLTRFLLYIQK